MAYVYIYIFLYFVLIVSKFHFSLIHLCVGLFTFLFSDECIPSRHTAPIVVLFFFFPFIYFFVIIIRWSLGQKKIFRPKLEFPIPSFKKLSWTSIVLWTESPLVALFATEFFFIIFSTESSKFLVISFTRLDYYQCC